MALGLSPAPIGGKDTPRDALNNGAMQYPSSANQTGRPRARPTRGFTLIEALISTATLATLAGIATPGMTQLVDQRATTVQADGLRSALHRARAEAVRRSEPVTLCARDAAAARHDAASTVCAAAGSRDWSAGWVVFVDRGERGELGPADQALWVEQPSNTALPVQATTRYVTFLATGISHSAAARFNVLPRGSADAATSRVAVCVNKPGKARVVAAPRCD